MSDNGSGVKKENVPQINGFPSPSRNHNSNYVDWGRYGLSETSSYHDGFTDYTYDTEKKEYAKELFEQEQQEVCLNQKSPLRKISFKLDIWISSRKVIAYTAIMSI